VYAPVCGAHQPAATNTLQRLYGAPVTNADAGTRYSDGHTVDALVHSDRRGKRVAGNGEPNKLQRLVHELYNELHGHRDDREHERYGVLRDTGCRGNVFVYDNRRQ
jgi:hypothetical protein